MHKQN